MPTFDKIAHLAKKLSMPATVWALMKMLVDWATLRRCRGRCLPTPPGGAYSSGSWSRMALPATRTGYVKRSWRAGPRTTLPVSTLN